MAISQVLLVCLGFCLLGKQAEGAVPTLALPVGTISVDETIAGGTTVTTLTVANTPNAGSITSQPNDGQFVLAHVTGIITLAAGFVLDYETATSYILVAQISNADGSASVTATISVTDITEEFSSSVMSVCLSGTTYSAGDALTTVSAGSTVTAAYTIQTQAPDSGILTMAGATGAISVATGKSINAAITPVFTLGIRLVSTAPAVTTTNAVLTITFGCSTSGAATLMVGSFALLLAMLVAMLQ